MGKWREQNVGRRAAFEREPVSRFLGGRAGRTPPGGPQEPAERVPCPLIPAGPGRESRRGLSLSGVTEPSASPPPSGHGRGRPGVPGKGFPACALRPPCRPLLTRLGSQRRPDAVTPVATWCPLLCPDHSSPPRLSPEGRSRLPPAVLQQIFTDFLRSGRPSARGDTAQPPPGRLAAFLIALFLSGRGQTLARGYGPFCMSVARLEKHFFSLP